MTTTGLYELIHERISEIEGHADSSALVIGDTLAAGDDGQRMVYFDDIAVDSASRDPKEAHRRKSGTEDQASSIVDLDKNDIRKKK